MIRDDHRNVQRFRGGLVFKAHRLCVSPNSRLESNKEEKKSRDDLGALFGREERRFLLPYLIVLFRTKNKAYQNAHLTHKNAPAPARAAVSHANVDG